MQRSSPSTAAQTRALDFDAKALEILRSECGGTTTLARFCEACGMGLDQLFGSGNAWIVAFETPSSGMDSRDDIVSEVIFPKKRFAHNFPHLTHTSSSILSSGAFWVEHVPCYVGDRIGDRRSTFSQYAILLSRTKAQILPDDAYLLTHAAKVMGNALTILGDNASLRHAIRAISGTGTLTRLADDYLGYEMLEVAKDIKGWKSLSIWRYSRITKSLEKLAEKNRDGSPLSAASIKARYLFPLVKERPSCMAICIEQGAAVGGRSIQLISSVTGNREVESHSPQALSGSLSHQLRIAVPRGETPYTKSDWERLESFCAALVAGISDRAQNDDMRFAAGDTICVLPFIRSRRPADISGSGKSHSSDSSDEFQFEATLVFHLGIDPIRVGHISFVRSFADRCVGTLDGLSQTHERLELWAEEIRSLQNVNSAEEFHRSLESLSRRLFDGSAVILWQEGLGVVAPRYRSQILEELSLEAAAEDIRLTDDEPIFFGWVKTNRQPWLKMVEQALADEFKTNEGTRMAGPTGRPRRTKQSVSGFLIPARTRHSLYLVAIMRDRSTRRRQMDLALCNALQSVFAKVLDRLNKEERDPEGEPNIQVRLLDQRTLMEDFCGTLERRVDGNSVLLLYADQDLNALSLASHSNATELAENTGLILPSESSLANLCYSLDAPLFGQVIDGRVVARRLGPNGEFDSDAVSCEFQGWLPNVASAIAAPLESGGRKFGVAIVAWAHVLEDAKRERQKRYLQVSGLCREFGELTRERRLEREAGLRESLAPQVHRLGQVRDPSLAPDMPNSVLLLPPELDQLFPSDFRSALSELLDRVVTETPCLSVTLRLADHFRSGLFLVGAAGRPGSEFECSLKDPESVSAYCFLNYRQYAAISLPRIRNGKPSVGGLYPGLVYATAREETRSQLCLPLVSRSGEMNCLGTLSFESAVDHGFQKTRGSCEELRGILEDLVDRRTSSARGELLRHIEYMGHLFAQEHHSLKDRFWIAESELTDSAEASFVPDIRQVFARHRQYFVERINTLDTLGNRLEFKPALCVDRVLARISGNVESWLDLHKDLESQNLSYGNPWLFEHAVENTLWQVVAFLRTTQSVQPSERFKVYVLLKTIPAENACLLAIAHNGPTVRPELVPFLFWYKIQSAEKGTGMGLALTGFEYRSMNMYAQASTGAPAFLQNAATESLTTWFTIHIPLR